MARPPRLWLLSLVALLVGAGCWSAYDKTYAEETARLEEQQRQAQEQERSEHAEASRYAAVVYFELGQSRLSADARRELDWFADKMSPYPLARIQVQGFADATGSESVNERLSSERAQAVADYLVSRGMSLSMLDVQAFGSDFPAKDNATSQGRRSNRRVEVTVR